MCSTFVSRVPIDFIEIKMEISLTMGHHYLFRTLTRVSHRSKVAVLILTVIAKLSFPLIRVGCLD